MTTNPDDKPDPTLSTVPLRINIDPMALRRKLSHALTLNYQRVAVGLNLAPHVGRESASIEEVQMRMSWAEQDHPSDEQIQEDFRLWILASGFREAVEAVHHFLDEADRVFAYMAIAQMPIVTWKELEQVEKKRAKFHRGGLGDKFDDLKKSAGVDVPAALRGWVESLNAGRNCLVHRGGRVGVPDIDESGKLRVRWQRVRLLLRTADGEEKELPGTVSKEGDSPIVKIEPAMKEFALGAQVVFTTEEYSQIMFTLNRMFEPVMSTLVEKLKAAGLVGDDGTLLSEPRAKGDAG